MSLDKTREAYLRNLYQTCRDDIQPVIDSILSGESNVTIPQLHSNLYINTVQMICMVGVALGIDERQFTNFAKEDWELLLSNLLRMCILGDREPRFNFDRIQVRREFIEQQYDTKTHYVLQFLEEFLNAQTLTHDPINWCELGELLNIAPYQ